jgi:(1->4)-alpha-D-glucan 1-alpha-D-glucosylmutase
MATLLGVEMRALGLRLAMLAGSDRYARDLSRAELSQALIETTASFPVYRSYIRNLDPSSSDRERIEQAVSEAKARRPQLNPAIFDFLRDVLLLLNRPHLLSEQREARLAFVTRWQQFTGPIMAKAFEDTVLYVYNPLSSLNEVGGDPRPSEAPSADFFEFVKQRSKGWPHSLNATTTHDTKRAEDVRARISVLSGIPEDWQAHLSHWSKLNAARRKLVKGQPVPNRNEEIFLYQTLLGMWPLHANDFSALTDRLQAYAIKASREAMVNTRWTLPNLPHERALKGFVASILRRSKGNSFLRDFSTFQDRVAYYGMINSLSQTLLKIASPGIPGFYQGSELWDFRLVDPDNRQPVDFAKRRAMIAGLKEMDQSPSFSLPEELTQNWQDGRIKLYLIWKALTFRREHGQLFSNGSFSQAEVHGERKENVSGFLRHHAKEWAMIVVPRWLARPHETVGRSHHERFWTDTEIRLQAGAPAIWRNVLTGEEMQSNILRGQRSLAGASLLRRFPVALLSGTRSSSAEGKKQRAS